MKNLLTLFLFLSTLNCLTAQIIDTIPFTKTVGLMKVPVQINGEIYSFIFDTGAEGCAIRSDLIDELNASWVKEEPLYDSHNNESMQSIYKLDSVQLGNKTFNDVHMLSFPNNPIFTCLEIDGIIGVNIIEQCKWIFDFGNEFIGIIEMDFDLIHENFLSLPFFIEGLRPIISLEIGNKTIDFLFDSGATTSDIDSVSVEAVKENILKSYKQIRETSGAITVNYKNEGDRIFVKANISSDYLAEFNTISIGENKIGNRFWNGNQVYLNWKEQKLALRITNDARNKYFGIAFKIKDTSIVVSSLLDTEQMGKHQINIGDRVLSINGITFKNNCELKTYIDNYNGDSFVLVLADKRQIEIMKE